MQLVNVGVPKILTKFGQPFWEFADEINQLHLPGARTQGAVINGIEFITAKGRDTSFTLPILNAIIAAGGFVTAWNDDDARLTANGISFYIKMPIADFDRIVPAYMPLRTKSVPNGEIDSETGFPLYDTVDLTWAGWHDTTHSVLYAPDNTEGCVSTSAWGYFLCGETISKLSQETYLELLTKEEYIAWRTANFPQPEFPI